MPATAPADRSGGNDGDDEASLLAAAQRGDTTAFGKLVMRHQSRLRRQMRHLVRGSDAVADELAQDVFVIAWKRIAEFRGEARFSTWLHRVAYRRFLMHLRSQTSRIETIEPAPANEPANQAGDAQGIDDDVARRLDVERALAGLPGAQRLALFHCFQLDLSHEEAAEVLGLPVGTLKSHVARAKDRLRESLAAWAPARREGS